MFLNCLKFIICIATGSSLGTGFISGVDHPGQLRREQGNLFLILYFLCGACLSTVQLKDTVKVSSACVIGRVSNGQCVVNTRIWQIVKKNHQWWDLGILMSLIQAIVQWSLTLTAKMPEAVYLCGLLAYMTSINVDFCRVFFNFGVVGVGVQAPFF